MENEAKNVDDSDNLLHPDETPRAPIPDYFSMFLINPNKRKNRTSPQLHVPGPFPDKTELNSVSVDPCELAELPTVATQMSDRLVDAYLNLLCQPLYKQGIRLLPADFFAELENRKKHPSSLHVFFATHHFLLLDANTSSPSHHANPRMIVEFGCALPQQHISGGSSLVYLPPRNLSIMYTPRDFLSMHTLMIFPASYANTFLTLSGHALLTKMTLSLMISLSPIIIMRVNSLVTLRLSWQALLTQMTTSLMISLIVVMLSILIM
jgi:hypothetical protein